jgi:hypothetical protein
MGIDMGKRKAASPMITFAALALAAVLAISCVSFEPAWWKDESGSVDPANAGDWDVPGDASGYFTFNDPTVYGFTQIYNLQEDPQVYTLKPNVNMRAWQKWDRGGLATGDYNTAYIKACRAKNILFIGGGTMSALFEYEAADRVQFLDWATRDATGGLVPQGQPPFYRGSLANPSYRAHLIAYLKKQIDLGVDGLFLDELNGIYSGDVRWNYNGNEGFDDYFLKDFNRYLMNKYPDYTWRDWSTRFGMTQDNIIRRDVPYTDLERNFNYRKYLQRIGYGADPRNVANPLAREWGYIVGNRHDIHDESFCGKYLRLYIKDIILSLREYARATYSKEILITSNGIMPYTDFNSLGLYGWNPDEPGNPSGADYVPLQSGHLNGSKSLKDVYLRMLAKSRDCSGAVPLVMFMDWPSDMINGYYNLPLAEKRDFWRIYAAEAYACGLRFAFHLRTVMWGEPTATESGILGFLTEYAAFYKKNAAYFQGAENTGLPVSIPGRTDIMANLTCQAAQGWYLLHLVNHNYANARMTPQTTFTVSVNLAVTPTAVTLISPDAAAPRSIPFTVNAGKVTMTVDRLDYYDLLVIQ